MDVPGRNYVLIVGCCKRKRQGKCNVGDHLEKLQPDRGSTNTAAELGERRTLDRKVAGSILTRGVAVCP